MEQDFGSGSVNLQNRRYVYNSLLYDLRTPASFPAKRLSRIGIAAGAISVGMVKRYARNVKIGSMPLVPSSYHLSFGAATYRSITHYLNVGYLNNFGECD